MKSKDITKYYTPWQVVRTEARDFSTPEEKLSYVLDYLKANLNYPNYERVYNWAEGLQKGYIGRNEDAVALIDDYLAELKELLPLPDKEKPEPPLSSYDPTILEDVYKDLYVRAEKWAKNYYFNEELLSYLEKLETAIKKPMKKSTKRLRQAQKEAEKKGAKSQHKFLY